MGGMPELSRAVVGSKFVERKVLAVVARRKS